MNPVQIRKAAESLWAARSGGRQLTRLLGDQCPTNLTDGYAIQTEAVRCAQSAVMGWKIAATSSAGQAHIGVDGPLAGPLLDTTLLSAPATLSLESNHMGVVELEFAFRFGGDCPARETRYLQDEVLARVETVHPCIEVPDSRFTNFSDVGPAQLVADAACAWKLVYGLAAVCDWRKLDFAMHEATLFVDGVESCRGKGANVLGDPRKALTWLVNELTGRGQSVKQGQLCTTGTCILPTPVLPGQRVVGDFGVLGTVEAHF